MNKYEKPTASIIDFEGVNIIATSEPDLLITWGDSIEDISYGNIDFYN